MVKPVPGVDYDVEYQGQIVDIRNGELLTYVSPYRNDADDAGYTATASIRFYRSADGGDSWEQVGTLTTGKISSVELIYSPGSGTVVVSGPPHQDTDQTGYFAIGGIFQSTDRGESWAQVFSPPHYGNFFTEWQPWFFYSDNGRLWTFAGVRTSESEESLHWVYSDDAGASWSATTPIEFSSDYFTAYQSYFQQQYGDDWSYRAYQPASVQPVWPGSVGDVPNRGQGVLTVNAVPNDNLAGGPALDLFRFLLYTPDDEAAYLGGCLVSPITDFAFSIAQRGLIS